MNRNEFETVLKKAKVALNDNGSIDYEHVLNMIQNYIMATANKLRDDGYENASISYLDDWTRLVDAEYDITDRYTKGGV